MASTPAYHESTLKTSGRDFLDYSTTHISNTFVSTSTNDPFRELLNNTVVAAIHNSSDRCDAPKCHPETRLAVQEHILGWAGYGDKKPPEQQILWVSGPAGAGKTAIMGTIADTLKKDGKLAASFFFSSFSKSKERGVKDHFVTTIVYQLTQHEGLENLKSAILSSVQKDPSIFKKCLREQAEALILKPLRQVALQPGALPEVIIIDGLDECGAIIHDDFKDSERTSAQNLRESDQLEVLSILQDLVKDASCPFRVIVASRPETVIKVSFSCLQPQACSIFLDDKYNPDVDITLFLKAKFAQIRLRYTRISPAWPREADIQQLVRNASGQFIYAATVIRFMETRRSTPQEQLKIVLKTRLTDSSNPLELLDALYGQVVKSSHKPIEALTWLKAYCTLDLAGDFGPTKAWFWCKLCESSEGEADFLLEKLSALLCASDLDAPCEASIVFYHKSFQDFLSDPSRYRAQFPNLSDETAGEWLVQRFKSALRLVAERQPQVRIGDPYFQDVFDAIVPLYWRAIPGHADYRTKRMRTIEGACQMVDKRFAPQDPASDGLLPSDIVILVTGRSGSGSSTLVNRVLGWSSAPMGVSLKSCTTAVTGYVARHAPLRYPEVNELLRGRRIVLLDTPGEEGDVPEPQWSSMIAHSLGEIYRRGMQTGRLLCPRDISLDRPRAPSDMLFNLCGPDRLDRVFFVTTKWDRIPDAFADAARRGGESDPAFVDGGASLHHLRPSGPIDTATKRILESINAHDPWEIVHAVLSSMENWGGGHQPLLIQDELVNKNLPWKETTAGQAGKGRGHRRGTGVRALKVNKLHTKRPKATVLEPPLPAPGGRALIPTPAPRPPPRAPPTPPSSTAPPSPTSSPLPPVPPSLPLPQRLRRWVRARMHV